MYRGGRSSKKLSLNVDSYKSDDLQNNLNEKTTNKILTNDETSSKDFSPEVALSHSKICLQSNTMSSLSNQIARNRKTFRRSDDSVKTRKFFKHSSETGDFALPTDDTDVTKVLKIISKSTIPEVESPKTTKTVVKTYLNRRKSATAKTVIESFGLPDESIFAGSSLNEEIDIAFSPSREGYDTFSDTKEITNDWYFHATESELPQINGKLNLINENSISKETAENDAEVNKNSTQGTKTRRTFHEAKLTKDVKLEKLHSPSANTRSKMPYLKLDTTTIITKNTSKQKNATTKIVPSNNKNDERILRDKTKSNTSQTPKENPTLHYVMREDSLSTAVQKNDLSYNKQKIKCRKPKTDNKSTGISNKSQSESAIVKHDNDIMRNLFSREAERSNHINENETNYVKEHKTVEKTKSENEVEINVPRLVETDEERGNSSPKKPGRRSKMFSTSSTRVTRSRSQEKEIISSDFILIETPQQSITKEKHDRKHNTNQVLSVSSETQCITKESNSDYFSASRTEHSKPTDVIVLINPSNVDNYVNNIAHNLATQNIKRQDPKTDRIRNSSSSSEATPSNSPSLKSRLRSQSTSILDQYHTSTPDKKSASDHIDSQKSQSDKRQSSDVYGASEEISGTSTRRCLRSTSQIEKHLHRQLPVKNRSKRESTRIKSPGSPKDVNLETQREMLLAKEAIKLSNDEKPIVLEGSLNCKESFSIDNDEAATLVSHKKGSKAVFRKKIGKITKDDKSTIPISKRNLNDDKNNKTAAVSHEKNDKIAKHDRDNRIKDENPRTEPRKPSSGEASETYNTNKSSDFRDLGSDIDSQSNKSINQLSDSSSLSFIDDIQASNIKSTSKTMIDVACSKKVESEGTKTITYNNNNANRHIIENNFANKDNTSSNHLITETLSKKRNVLNSLKPDKNLKHNMRCSDSKVSSLNNNAKLSPRKMRSNSRKSTPSCLKNATVVLTQEHLTRSKSNSPSTNSSHSAKGVKELTESLTLDKVVFVDINRILNGSIDVPKVPQAPDPLNTALENKNKTSLIDYTSTTIVDEVSIRKSGERDSGFIRSTVTESPKNKSDTNHQNQEFNVKRFLRSSLSHSPFATKYDSEGEIMSKHNHPQTTPTVRRRNRYSKKQEKVPSKETSVATGAVMRTPSNLENDKRENNLDLESESRSELSLEDSKKGARAQPRQKSQFSPKNWDQTSENKVLNEGGEYLVPSRVLINTQSLNQEADHIRDTKATKNFIQNPISMETEQLQEFLLNDDNANHHKARRSLKTTSNELNYRNYEQPETTPVQIAKSLQDNGTLIKQFEPCSGFFTSEADSAAERSGEKLATAQSTQWNGRSQTYDKSQIISSGQDQENSQLRLLERQEEEKTQPNQAEIYLDTRTEAAITRTSDSAISQYSQTIYQDTATTKSINLDRVRVSRKYLQSDSDVSKSPQDPLQNNSEVPQQNNFVNANQSHSYKEKQVLNVENLTLIQDKFANSFVPKPSFRTCYERNHAPVEVSEKPKVNKSDDFNKFEESGYILVESEEDKLETSEQLKSKPLNLQETHKIQLDHFDKSQESEEPNLLKSEETKDLGTKPLNHIEESKKTNQANDISSFAISGNSQSIENLNNYKKFASETSSATVNEDCITLTILTEADRPGFPPQTSELITSDTTISEAVVVPPKEATEVKQKEQISCNNSQNLLEKAEEHGDGASLMNRTPSADKMTPERQNVLKSSQCDQQKKTELREGCTSMESRSIYTEKMERKDLNVQKNSHINEEGTKWRKNKRKTLQNSQQIERRRSLRGHNLQSHAIQNQNHSEEITCKTSNINISTQQKLDSKAENLEVPKTQNSSKNREIKDQNQSDDNVEEELKFTKRNEDRESFCEFNVSTENRSQHDRECLKPEEKYDFHEEISNEPQRKFGLNGEQSLYDSIDSVAPLIKVADSLLDHPSLTIQKETYSSFKDPKDLEKPSLDQKLEKSSFLTSSAVPPSSVLTVALTPAPIVGSDPPLAILPLPATVALESAGQKLVDQDGESIGQTKKSSVETIDQRKPTCESTNQKLGEQPIKTVDQEKPSCESDTQELDNLPPETVNQKLLPIRLVDQKSEKLKDASVELEKIPTNATNQEKPLCEYDNEHIEKVQLESDSQKSLLRESIHQNHVMASMKNIEEDITSPSSDMVDDSVKYCQIDIFRKEIDVKADQNEEDSSLKPRRSPRKKLRSEGNIEIDFYNTHPRRSFRQLLQSVIEQSKIEAGINVQKDAEKTPTKEKHRTNGQLSPRSPKSLKRLTRARSKSVSHLMFASTQDTNDKHTNNKKRLRQYSEGEEKRNPIKTLKNAEITVGGKSPNKGNAKRDYPNGTLQKNLDYSLEPPEIRLGGSLASESSKKEISADCSLTLKVSKTTDSETSSGRSFGSEISKGTESPVCKSFASEISKRTDTSPSSSFSSEASNRAEASVRPASSKASKSAKTYSHETAASETPKKVDTLSCGSATSEASKIKSLLRGSETSKEMNISEPPKKSATSTPLVSKASNTPSSSFAAERVSKPETSTNKSLQTRSDGGSNKISMVVGTSNDMLAAAKTRSRLDSAPTSMQGVLKGTIHEKINLNNSLNSIETKSDVDATTKRKRRDTAPAKIDTQLSNEMIGILDEEILKPFSVIDSISALAEEGKKQDSTENVAIHNVLDKITAIAADLKNLFATTLLPGRRLSDHKLFDVSHSSSAETEKVPLVLDETPLSTSTLKPSTSFTATTSSSIDVTTPPTSSVLPSSPASICANTITTSTPSSNNAQSSFVLPPVSLVAVVSPKVAMATSAPNSLVFTPNLKAPSPVVVAGQTTPQKRIVTPLKYLLVPVVFTPTHTSAETQSCSSKQVKSSNNKQAEPSNNQQQELYSNKKLEFPDSKQSRDKTVGNKSALGTEILGTKSTASRAKIINAESVSFKQFEIDPTPIVEKLETNSTPSTRKLVSESASTAKKCGTQSEPIIENFEAESVFGSRKFATESTSCTKKWKSEQMPGTNSVSCTGTFETESIIQKSSTEFATSGGKFDTKSNRKSGTELASSRKEFEAALDIAKAENDSEVQLLTSSKRESLRKLVRRPYDEHTPVITSDSDVSTTPEPRVLRSSIKLEEMENNHFSAASTWKTEQLLHKKTTLNKMIVKAHKYKVGDLAWGKLGSCPFWPCMISMDPHAKLFKKENPQRLSKSMYHVRFFGDRGRRAWVKKVLPFTHKNDLTKYANLAKQKKCQNLFIKESFEIAHKYVTKWNIAVEEATNLLGKNLDERFEFFNKILFAERLRKKTTKANAPRNQIKEEVTTGQDLKPSLSSELASSSRLIELNEKSPKPSQSERSRRSSAVPPRKFQEFYLGHAETEMACKQLVQRPEKRPRSASLSPNKFNQIKSPSRNEFASSSRSNSPIKLRPRQSTGEKSDIPSKKPTKTEPPTEEKNEIKVSKAQAAPTVPPSDTESKISDDSAMPASVEDLVALYKRNKFFKGVSKERVCQVCEKPGDVLRCRGPCCGIFHFECARKIFLKFSQKNHNIKTEVIEPETLQTSAIIEEHKSIDESEEVTQVFSNEELVHTEIKKEVSEKLKNGDVEIVTVHSRKSNKPPVLTLSPQKGRKLSLSDHIDRKMKEIMDTIDVDQYYITDSSSDEMSERGEIKSEVSDDKSSISSEIKEEPDDCQRELRGRTCVYSESYKRERKPKKSKSKIFKHVTADDIAEIQLHSDGSVEGADDDHCILDEIELDGDNFKCAFCLSNIEPPCFVCDKKVSKNGSEIPLKCAIKNCGRYYHINCLKEWPQTQVSFGYTKSQHDDFFCPTHVCHTCASDDPRAAIARCSSDKLVRCLRCPATYHTTNYCIPAGTDVLTCSQVICPRHIESKRHQHTINTTWCFVCSEGGNLICCETCPTSVHMDCMPINLTEDDRFICEDCESGRLPLYGEIVWVKLGSYRWWPAVILFPNEIPKNIQQMKHCRGEFAVKFYGTYDHYWVSRGRAFLYQEGDKGGHFRTTKKVVESAFAKALEESAAAHQVKNEFKRCREAEKNNGLKPPPYIRIKVNKPVGNVKTVDSDKTMTACDCDPNQSHPCGPDTDCLNRLLLTECDPTVCPAGERCNNQQFEKREYPPLIPYKTEGRGWGLKALAPIQKGQFVIEYVGELIDDEEYQRRIEKMHQRKDENYYFLTIDKTRMLDAGPKGNVARFMNHSCQPNCETQKWTVNGDTRVGLFATEDIPANTELTFNYNLECVGTQKKICRCNAPMCSGYIGVKVKQEKEESVKKTNRPKKYKKKVVVVEESCGSCFICGSSSGEFGQCNNKACSKYYHLKCVKLSSWPPGSKWICPCHNCNICEKRTIRCCTKCTNSYCPEHSQDNIRYDSLLGFICHKHDTRTNESVKSQKYKKLKYKRLKHKVHNRHTGFGVSANRKAVTKVISYKESSTEDDNNSVSSADSWHPPIHQECDNLNSNLPRKRGRPPKRRRSDSENETNKKQKLLHS